MSAPNEGPAQRCVDVSSTETQESCATPASFRPFVSLHSDAVLDLCDCGDREWEVELPLGWHWSTMQGPGPFATLDAAMSYARLLHPEHDDVRPSGLRT